MEFFTKDEFEAKYNIQITDEVAIGIASEMIYSQIGLMFRKPDWNDTTVPDAIKNASMEQLRFMMEYQIPSIDFKGEIQAGNMRSNLKTDYSTLALRMLANGGYLYRGNPINHNIGMDLPF